MAVLVSLVIHVRGIREVLDSRGTVQATRDPHDTEGVRCTYIGHDGIVLGVTPPRTLHKMNQDKECLFNANITIMNLYAIMYNMTMFMITNELMHDYVKYKYE
jgi:hypothetical protein